MRLTSNTTTATLFFLFLCQFSEPAFGQLGFSLGLKKPKEYSERTLRSERSEEKKFTVPRRFMQNTVTHYNFFFNANNKINEIVERAKMAHKDDYSQLLSFYNYSLDVTAGDTLQIDSVSYKVQTGIALHDLRNDWIDNLYLLWGTSYYLRKEFDSAYLMFQYINYAFAQKEKDGYYKTIGSGRDGTAYSIATKEKNSLPRKIFSEPPSRNDAFIWQIRNFLAQDLFAEAASLIVTLRNDPVFPKRLQNDLEEVQAYWFYKQAMWDSAAVHLSQALDNATNKQERARWEYLVAQLYENANKPGEAEGFYAKAIKHTTDPILDIYARLYSIRVNKDGGEGYIEKNIAELLKMAKRDKYEEYRDIIYYMAAQMQLERNNIDAAIPLLVKSTQYNNNNPAQRNKAFLQLAELSFGKKLFRQSYNFYDSLRMDDPELKNPEAILQRKEALGNIAASLEIIERQDSLQRIAALPDEERRDIVKKLVKQLRKQQGLKDESVGTTTGSPFQQTPAANLFSNNDTKGEWYFYNTSSKMKGANDFKARWGNRPNTDNWRRSANRSNMVPDNNQLRNPNVVIKNNTDNGGETEATFEGLYSKLPLTVESLQKSNDSVKSALFNLGKSYIQEIEDCMEGTATLENLRTRFPEFKPMDEVLFNLYYCYNKNGETAKAAAIKKLLNDNYGSSNFTTIVTTGKNPQSKTANSDATKTYEKIYDLFIEGKFSEAIAQKKIADSLYSSNYWTPQLLYIEAVYYVRQREDSIATKILTDITINFPKSPLAERAANLINVLKNRSKIEEELKNLVVNRPAEEVKMNRPVVNNNPVIPPPVVKKDTVAVNKPVIPPVAINNKPAADSANKKQVVPPPAASPFTFAATDPQFVVLVLNKVDPVFSNEAKNAFFRHNRETFYNKQFAIDLLQLDDDNRLMLISPFKDAADALSYIEKTRPRTANEIIPWLKGGKYYFTMISERNLELLKANKNLEGYKTFLNQQLPGKF